MEERVQATANSRRDGTYLFLSQHKPPHENAGDQQQLAVGVGPGLRLKLREEPC